MKSADHPFSNYQVPMMPVGLRLMFVRGAGSYLLYLCALGIVIVVGGAGAKVVARNFVAIVEQSVNDNPRTLSRVERHLQTVARIEFHQPVQREDQIIALATPAMPPVILAAAIDRAERADQPSALPSHHHTRVEGWVKSADREPRKKRKALVLAASSKKSGKASKAAKLATVQVAQAAPKATAAVVAVAEAPPAQAPASQKYLSGKMALLPPSSSKMPPAKLHKSVKAGTQAAAPPPLPTENLPKSPASPGEIIRVSLLGPP